MSYFRGSNWIQRANTYEMVDLLGNLIGDNFLYGEVYSAQELQGTFSLDRIILSSIKLSEESISIKKDNETIIQAIIYEGNNILNIQEKVIWKSSDTSVVELGEEISLGTNSIKIKGLQDGTATITATLDNGNSSICKIIVGTGRKNNNTKFSDYFIKKGDNYYYTGKTLKKGTYTIKGNLIIDKEMKF